MIIGIAGYMGSGKSTIAKAVVEQFDATLLDADKIARKMMVEDKTIISAISDRFGVVFKGQIDFGKLGKNVFEDPNALDDLNAIVHPPLIKKLNSLAQKSNSIVIIDAALLTLWGDRVVIDYGIWVDASLEFRTERLAERTGLHADDVAKRIRSQMNLFAMSSSDKWVVIENNSEIEIALKNVIDQVQLWN